MKQRGLARRVVGFVRREASVDECLKHGVVDAATLDLREAVTGADLVVFCTPLAQMRALGSQMAGHLRRGCLVTDVGSVKATVHAALEQLMHEAGAHFIGSHPMAGSEKTGPSAARADLFQHAMCLVTSTPASRPAALRKTVALWQAVGGRVLKIAPEEHDDLVSRSSHLPHLVAAQLAAFVLDPARPETQARLCASGFRDTTRVASGSPEMWRDIALANREFIGKSLKAFIRELERLCQKVEAGDEAALEKFFGEVKTRRDAWSEKWSSRSLE